MPSLSAFSMRFAFESVNKLHSFYFSTLVLCIAHFLYYSKLMTNAHSNYAMKRLMAAHCESNRECFCCINGKARIRLEKSRKQIANEKEVKPITYHAEREPEREREMWSDDWFIFCRRTWIVLTASHRMARAMRNIEFSHYIELPLIWA